MEKKPTLAIRLDAGHDSNGNPQRGWLIVDAEGTGLAFVDEGYSGVGELRKRFGKIPETGSLRVAKSEYRALLRTEERGEW